MRQEAGKLPICLATLRRILPLVPGWPNLAAMTLEDAAFCVGSIHATSAMMRGGEAFYTRGADRAILQTKAISIKPIAKVPTLVISIPQPKT